MQVPSEYHVGVNLGTMWAQSGPYVGTHVSHMDLCGAHLHCLHEAKVKQSILGPYLNPHGTKLGVPAVYVCTSLTILIGMRAPVLQF